jgi:hypothetical protein
MKVTLCNAGRKLVSQEESGEENMRIAQVAPLFESVPPRCYGGTERIVSYLTEELVRLGHDVTLFASGDSVTSSPPSTRAAAISASLVAFRRKKGSSLRSGSRALSASRSRLRPRSTRSTKSISAYGLSRCSRGPALNSSVRSTRLPRANSSARRSPCCSRSPGRSRSASS